MKTTKHKLQVILVPISLTLVVFVAAGYSAAGKPSLSKKEVKALIASAKTKEDHLKLAEYYKGEVARLEAEATDHDEMAEMYRKNPTPLAVKHPEAIAFDGRVDSEADKRDASSDHTAQDCDRSFHNVPTDREVF